MRAHHALLPAAALAVAGGLALATAPAPAGSPLGAPVPDDFAPEGFARTKAESFEDYAGRLVLVEYFAYW